MLTKEKIVKNAKKFHDTGIKYNAINDKLMEMLGEGFISSPCTSSTNFHGAYEGGLIEHIINTTKYALGINDSLPESKRANKESLIRVCLIHQLGKAKMFIEQTSKWHRENRGEMYTWNDELLSMSTSERSIYYALKSGIDLTEDEVYAIYNYNSEFAQKPLTSEGDRLAAVLRVANMVATIEEK